MSVVLGRASPAPRRFSVPSSGSVFPHTPASYSDDLGTIIVPPGALDRFYTWRAGGGATRGEVVGFGDSTMHGAGGLYPWLVRLRDRAVAAGLIDGGKGCFGALETELVYDSPEINGVQSKTGFGNTLDAWDLYGGGMMPDDGTVANRTLTLQFREPNARLWYLRSSVCGEFTYSVDGGPPVTVDAYMASGAGQPTMIYLSGLGAGPHTVLVTNLAGRAGSPSSPKQCRIALAPMNDVGFTTQRIALTGQTFNNFIVPWRWHAALGLTAPSGDATLASSYSVDVTPPLAGRVKPVLALLELGFNDLTADPAGAAAKAMTGIQQLAAACQAASCDGVIVSGQLPYNANWVSDGAALFAALKNTATSNGLAWVDLFYPVHSITSGSWVGGTGDPHLPKSQYQAQADWLWDNLLGLV